MERVLRVAAYGLMLQEQKILLCRLTPEYSDTRAWTLPGGGLEFGEHPREAAIREVLEETGYCVEVDENPHIDSEVFRDFAPAMHILRLIYRARIVGGELRHETDGSTDRCEWFTYEETLGLPLVSLAELGIRIAFAS